MRKTCFILLFVMLGLASLQAINQVIRKPLVEGKGMRGWVIDSIQLNTNSTVVFIHFGLGKGFRSSGDLDSYIEIPETGERLKQTGINGLPLAPDFVEGKGQTIFFQKTFPPIKADTKCINITDDQFDGTGAAWYGVWLKEKTTVFTGKLAAIPYLQGNWYSIDGNGSFTLGLYEKKAFWNGEFLNYGKIKGSKGKGSIELISKAGAKIVLKLKVQKDSNLILSSKQYKELVLSKTPEFKIADETSYKKNYSSDSVTVSGYYQVANPVFSKRTAILVPDLISEKDLVYPIKVEADGTFKVRIPLKYATELTFSNQLGPRSPLSQQRFIAEPGDHILLTYRNEDENGIVFSGDNARLNNERQTISLRSTQRLNLDSRSEKYQDTEDIFLSKHYKEIRSIWEGYATWQDTHPKNNKLDTWMKLHTDYSKFTDMLNYYAKNPKVKSKENFLPYMDDMDFYNNPSARLTPAFLAFIDAYKRYNDYTLSITLTDILKFIQEKSKPDPNSIRILLTMDSMRYSIKSREDAATYKSYSDKNLDLVTTFFKTYSKDIQDYIEKVKKESESKSIFPEGYTRSLSIARTYGTLLSTEETALTPDQVLEFEAKCKDYTLVNLVLNKNKDILNKIEKIKNTPLPEGVNVFNVPEDASDLTATILKKYAGKVIYVDFWATWCGPCKREMPFSEERKKELKGKNIVFLYITGESSPELIWKKMISEMSGEHCRLTAKQWDSICKEHAITGIPHYFIVNKNGEIVDKNAPRPSAGEVMIQAVQKLF